MPSNAQSQTLPNPFRAPAAEYLDREQPLDAAGAIALLGRRRRLHTIELGFGICGADLDPKCWKERLRAPKAAFAADPGLCPATWAITSPSGGLMRRTRSGDGGCSLKC